MRQADLVEDALERLGLRDTIGGQSVLSIPFQLLISDQGVRQRPAKARDLRGFIFFVAARDLPEGELRFELPDFDQPLPDDVDEDVEHGMPLVLLDVEEAHVGRVRRIVHLQAAPVRRVVQSREEDQRAEERLADARQAHEEAEKTIEEEAEVRERVVQTKVAQGEKVRLVDEEQAAQQANEEQLEEQEDDHRQEEFGEDLEHDQRKENVAR